jgi:hypothetical protein
LSEQDKKLDRFKDHKGRFDISPLWALVIVVLELIEELKRFE